MQTYIIRRVLLILPTLFLISIIVFFSLALRESMGNKGVSMPLGRGTMIG